MKIIKNFLIFVNIIFLSFLLSCSSEKKNLVITSFFANDSITRSLVKNTNIEVECLISGSVEPHDFEPTARQRAKMEDSKLIIVNGLGLEEYLSTLENTNLKDKICYSNSNTIELSNDPHSFVSPREAINICDTIASSLINTFSDYKEIILKNEEEYLTKLEQIDKNYKSFFSSTNNLYVLGHSAYNYLARDYNMNVKSVLGLSEEEASAQSIKEICDYIRENNIKTIYGEYGEENDTIKSIASSTSANIKYVYTAEMNVDQTSSYLDILEKNLIIFSA